MTAQSISPTPVIQELPTSTMTAVDQLLKDKPEAVQLKVLKLLKLTKIRENDVMFLVMLAIGQLEGLLEHSPKELAALFESWESLIFDRLKEAEKVAIKAQQTAIAQSVSDLIRKTDSQERKSFFRSVVPAFGLLTASIGIGVILGISVPVWLSGGYMSDTPRKLTFNEAEVLRWGMSAEGKYARDLIKWNPNLFPLTSPDCLSDVKALNVTMKVQGRDTIRGWCALWVIPSQKRQYSK